MVTISLCMIAKNAGKTLQKCLDSVKSIVDEIIIVDTGSTDNTKDIAKAFNAKVIDFKWIDDFSAARNESLRHATKDWILVLDADEDLDSDGAAKIKELIKENNEAYFLIQKNYTNNPKISGFVSEPDGKNNFAGWYASLIARLFRNKREFEFSGTVHELIEPSIEHKSAKIAPSNVIIHHFGNIDPDIVKKKREFYLDLCKKKVKNSPDSNSYLELGILYKENEDLENALTALKKSIELDPKNRLAHFELGVIYERRQEFDPAISHYTESLRIKNDSEAYSNLGVCYLKKGMLKEAKRNLLKSLIMNPHKYTIYNNLGAVLDKLGDLKGAINILETGIKLNPNNATGHYNLGVVYDKMNNFKRALLCFEKAVSLGHKNKDKIKERISKLRELDSDTSRFSYGFKFGD